MTDYIKISQLVNAYAHFADRREPQKQAELFTTDAIVEVYQGEKLVQTLKGRNELKEAFSGLKQYEKTTHINGQSTFEINDSNASGETYCLAHHLWTEQEQRKLMIMSIRYEDTFIKEQDKWLFSKRKLIIDWTDTKPNQ